MRKRCGVWSVLVAGVLTLGVVSTAGAETPRWVTHVKRYPGGISNGVRAYAAPKTAGGATSFALIAPAARPNPSLRNLQINSLDASPRVPQNETQVVLKPSHPMTAVAGANDYVNGGSQLYQTTDGGRHWSTQFRSARVFETNDFCGGGGDPALAYSRRDHAFYFAQLCFFRNHTESEI